MENNRFVRRMENLQMEFAIRFKEKEMLTMKLRKSFFFF